MTRDEKQRAKEVAAFVIIVGVSLCVALLVALSRVRRGAAQRSFPASSRVLRFDSFDVHVSVEPPSPSAALDSGVFSIIVSARNPTNEFVRPGLDTALRGKVFARHLRPDETFGYEIDYPDGDRHSYGGSIANAVADTVFAPGETKRQVFRFRVGDTLRPRTFAPGVYHVRAHFRGKDAPVQTVTLRSR